MEKIPTIEIIQMLAYIKENKLEDTCKTLYEEYKIELKKRLEPLGLLY